MHQVRAVTLTDYVEVANSVGLDGQRMLREAGFGREALADPENGLPAKAVLRLLERSAELSHCDSFGLLLAERRTLASLGPVSLLLERLPNVREVVRAGIELRGHINNVVSMALEDEGDTCLIRLDMVSGLWGVQTLDLFVGIAYRILAGASGGRWKPACVHLVRKTPDSLIVWRRVFPAPIEFEDAFTGFSSSQAAIQAPNPLANEAMAAHARRLLELVPLAARPETVSDRARQAIVRVLPSGRPTIDQVAAQMGMSPRSLQRRLDEEGHQFAGLLAEVRRELAAAYLTGSTQPVTSVAGLLGYASPSSFTRWFTAEFGNSPQVWRGRRQARGHSGPPPRRPH